MPSSNHETTLARQWELLKILPSRPPGMTSRDARERLEGAGHEVTKRTVERDLSELSRVFPILSNEISKPYGWYWKPGARVDIPGMDLAEAVSLGLLEDLLRQLIPATFTHALEGRFAEAKEKLKSLPHNRYAKWSDLVRYMSPRLPLQRPVIDAEVFRNVQEALIKKRQLKISYRGLNAESDKELTLHPLGIIQQGERSYLLATTFDYPNVLHYAIHRIRSAEVLDVASKQPSKYSLDSFIDAGGGQFGVEKSITLKATITHKLAAILHETPLSTDQKIITHTEENILTASINDSWQLRFWLLSHGPEITIIQPVALRKHIAKSLQEALANYNS